MESFSTVEKQSNIKQLRTVRPSKLTLRSFDFIVFVTLSLPTTSFTLYSSGEEVVCSAMLASFKARMMAHITSNAFAISIFSEFFLRFLTSGSLKTSLNVWEINYTIWLRKLLNCDCLRTKQLAVQINEWAFIIFSVIHNKRVIVWELERLILVILAVSIGKWSAASEGYVEHVFMTLGSIVEGWVNMSY